MKKVISMVLTLALLFALSVPAFATDGQALTQAEKEALYAKYEKMAAAANEKYGLDISVLPFDELETFYSEEEYAQILADFCGLLLAPQVRVDGEGPIGALKGVGTTVVPYYIKHVHGSATVSITIQGTFNIGYYPGGPYYINWMSFDAVTSSSSSTLFYAKNGGASVTGYIDGGRTMVVTQNFDIYTYGTLTASTSANAYFYFNEATGTVSAQ